MLTLSDSALHFIHSGMSVIPIKARDKRPVGQWKQYQKNAPSEGQARAWFTTGSVNLGVVTGYGGLVVIDFDDHLEYMNWQHWAGCTPSARLVAQLTYRVRTQRGVHVYIRLPHETRTRRIDGHAIDVKARGGYVLAPPSIHPSGHIYTAPNPNAPILSVQALSEILPAALLLPSVSNSPTEHQTAQQQDPWTVIENVTALGPGAVEAIRARVSITDLLSTPLVQTGPNFYLTQCPLHDDHDPSLWVNTELGVCNCYAGCSDKPMDVINLFARLHDLTNREAIAAMAR